MNNKRPYGKAFATIVQRKPFRTFPQNTTINTTPMVLYRTPSQFKSLTNPRTGREWPEKKNIDVSGSLGVSGVYSEIDFLNGAAQGVGSSDRIGRKVQLKSLLFRWHESSTAAFSFPLRVLIIYDKAPEQVLPGLADILSVGGFNAPMNLSNSDRFVVLVDDVIQPLGAPAQIGCRAGTYYRKLNLPARYEGTTATVDSITTGALFCLIGYPFAGAGQGIGYTSRVRYTDV